MKSFYLVFACSVFAVFCLLEFRGVSMDSNHRIPTPEYYSYRGGGAAVGVAGASRRSYYSHK